MNFTSLHNACSRGDLSVIKSLLDEGVDINCTDDFGNTPLHQAVDLTLLSRWFSKNGVERAMIRNFIIGISENMTRMLISRGASVNLKDTRSRTPLHIAASEKNSVAIRILLENNSDINEIDIDGRSALHYIAQSGDLEGTKILLENGSDINATDLNGYTPLHFAALHMNIDVCDLLIQYKCEINTPNKWLDTPFLLAVVKSDSSIGKLLIDNGADGSATDERGKTALHIAVGYENHNVICFLLNHCISLDINSKDCAGVTALHTSVVTCNSNISKLLLSHGADVNVQDNIGETPIHSLITQLYDPEYPRLEFTALFNSRLKVISTLLDYHADLTIVSRCKTALGVVMGSDFFPNVKQEILEYICKIKIAHLPVSKKYSDSLLFPDDHVFRRKCEQEVELLKDKRIGNVPLYHLLKTPVTNLVSYLKNSEISNLLCQRNFKELVVYSSLLEAQYSLAAYRYELIKASSPFFTSVITVKPQLNYDCIEYLLSFLANKDLQLLSFCVKANC